MPQPSVILAGARASGKTSVGKVVSAISGLPFIDADDMLTAQLRKENYQDIADFIKHQNGDWLGFREKENAILERILHTSHSSIVLALGGGAVANNQSEFYCRKNSELLKSFGVGVYLTPSDDLAESARILVERVQSDPNSPANRPAFSGKGPYEEMLETLQQRDPLYREFADYIVLTKGKSVDEIAKEIF